MSREADSPATSRPTPSAAMAQHLAELAKRWGAESIDELWVFPTQTIGASESTVIVVSVFDDDEERRRVMTAQLSTQTGAKQQTNAEWAVAEHGVAPADRIERLIEGVLRRLDGELNAVPPHTVRINGREDRWEHFLHELKNQPDEAGGSPTNDDHDDRPRSGERHRPPTVLDPAGPR